MTAGIQPRLSTAGQIPSSATYVADDTLTQAQKEELAASKMRSLTYLTDKWQSGVPPTNAEIDSFLTHLETTQAFESHRGELSAEGAKVLDDTKAFFAEFRRFVREKNEGEVLQKFVVESREGGKVAWRDHGDQLKSNAANLKNEIKKKGVKGKAREVAPDDEVTAGNEAYQKAATVARLLVSSPKFRSLLVDAVSLSQYVLAGLAEKSAKTLRERGDAVVQNNQDVYHEASNQNGLGAPGSVAAPYNQPTSSSNIPPLVPQTQGVHTNSVNPNVPAANVTTHSEIPNSRPPTEGEAARDAANTANSAIPAALADTQTAQNIQQGAANAAAKTTNALTSKLSPEAQARALAAKDAVVGSVKEEIPQEKRDEIVAKLKDLIRETQEHPEYQEAIEYLWNTFSELNDKGKAKIQQTTDTVQSGEYNKEVHTHVLTARDYLRTFIERLAGGRPLGPLINSLDAIRLIIQNDKDLHTLFDRFKWFTRASLQQPGYIDRQEWKDEGNHLITSIRTIMDERYRPQTETLKREGQLYRDALRDDVGSRKLSEAGARINQDLFKDANGNLTFKPTLLSDLQNVVLPVLTNEIRVIPVPKITVDNPDVYLSLDNIILTTAAILPSLIEMEMHNSAVVALKKGSKSVSEHKLTVGVYQIQAKMDNVKFEVRKKKGFPTITDSGLASLLLARNGLSIRVTLQLSPVNPHRTVRLTQVQAHIDTLKIRLSKTKHQALYSLVLPLLNSTIKTAIARAIEKTIRDQIGALDGTITKQKVEKARVAREEKERLKREALENGSGGVKNRLSGVFGTAKRRATEKKEEAKNTAGSEYNKLSVDKDRSRVSYENGAGVEAINGGVKATDGKGGSLTLEAPTFGSGTSGTLDSTVHAPKHAHQTHQEVLAGGNGTTNPSASTTTNTSTTAGHTGHPTQFAEARAHQLGDSAVGSVGKGPEYTKANATTTGTAGEFGHPTQFAETRAHELGNSAAQSAAAPAAAV
ncbi:hypothetical protein HDV00_002770 [Rhizophlyctis rosea]|nr:hypothetical protein HDV00_002770 [Rhizophlyctis rosea]